MYTTSHTEEGPAPLVEKPRAGSATDDVTSSVDGQPDGQTDGRNAMTMSR